MKQVTSSRLVLNKAEREIRKTWGRYWERMKRDERKHGYFYVIVGDWSGYTSSQYRITHRDYIPVPEAENLKLNHVRFTDGTGMSVWTEKLTIADLLRKEYERKHGYTQLISEAMRTGEACYAV